MALLQPPVEAAANATTPAESFLMMALAISAGILGLSASLLYRHMHRVEENVRTRAENAEAELRGLLLMTDDAVLLIAADGTLRAGNPAAEEVFGRSSDDFVGKPLTELIAQPLCLTELTKNGPVNFETTARRPGEEYARVEMLISPVELNGRTSYMTLVRESRMGMAKDSERQTSPGKDFTKALEKFTHDLNNQFTSIIGNLSLILMNPPNDPTNYERILNAKKTALRAQALSQNLQTLVAGNPPSDNAWETERSAPCTIVPMPVVTQPLPVAAPAAPRKARILVLDDEEAICGLVAAALNSMSFEVTEASSVRIALRACEDAERDGRPYELVISDLCLPGDVSGSDAVRQLRAISPDIKAIVSSGYDNDPIMCDCRKHGFAAALAKPYEISKLGRTVREVLAAGSTDTRKTA